MFPQFGATAETLSKASTMVFRIGTDAHLYDDPEDVSIAPLLDSKFDSEKCEALKRLLALIAQGFDVSNFFPQVVNNVASQSLEVKKLAYLYLLHYAEKRPNEALLSINCFQKDLGDPNPLVRAWALRTMAGIRLLVIAPLVLVAVGKCARDPSVYVRKCAANALPKLHDLRLEEQSTGIEELVGVLLNDHSPGVVGAAAASFAAVCPNNFTLIGRNYRRLCQILPDVEEWGQVVLIGILLRYAIARHGLVQESIMFSLHGTGVSHSKLYGCDSESSLQEDSDNKIGSVDFKLENMVSRCYIESPDEYLSRTSYTNKVPYESNCTRFTSARNNDDVKILLQCTSPLLWSNNSAVVLAAAGVQWIMAPKEDVSRIVKPLVFLQRSSNASKYVVLCNIQVFAKTMPSIFAPFFEDFFIRSSDTYEIKALKLAILSSIATDSSISCIFREFQDYIRDPDRRFAADTVATIGLCADQIPDMANTCVEGLLALIGQEFLTRALPSLDGEADVLIQAIASIKTIIAQDPIAHEKVIIQLVRSLDSIKVSPARAMIIWIVGEYSSVGEIIPRMLATVLKYLAWCFKSEALETKLQILNTTAKILISVEGEDLPIYKRVFNYVLDLAECDMKYDVRDRARFLKKLVPCNPCPQGLEEETKFVPQENNMLHVLVDHLLGRLKKDISLETTNSRFYLPGSLSQIVLHAAPGYEPLPKPCSLAFDDLNMPISTLRDGGNYSDTEGSDDHETSPGSLDEDGSSEYGSQLSITGSSHSAETRSTCEGDDTVDPLIQISDIADGCKNQNGNSHFGSAGMEELMSRRALESWLDEQDGSSNVSTSGPSQAHGSSARISIGDIGSSVKPKNYTLLDPTNGYGLKVTYSFSSKVSDLSPLLVCMDVSLENSSSEIISGVALVDEESARALNSVAQDLGDNERELTAQDHLPTLVPMEEITSLEPGQKIKRILQAHFHHHLLPLKLTLCCNGKKLPVKLRPDIGYFVRPLQMDVEAFIDKESRLPGMFEYIRRCTYTDHIGNQMKDSSDHDNLFTEDKFLNICKSLVLKMLSNTNLFLVYVDMPIAANHDDASGLRLRFSSEILSSSIPCLITITVEGKCSECLDVSVKVNCEETVFGLNLLNRIVNFLVEPL